MSCSKEFNYDKVSSIIILLGLEGCVLQVWPSGEDKPGVGRAQRQVPRLRLHLLRKHQRRYQVSYMLFLTYFQGCILCKILESCVGGGAAAGEEKGRGRRKNDKVRKDKIASKTGSLT